MSAIDGSQNKRKSVTMPKMERNRDQFSSPTNIWSGSKLLEPGNMIARFTLETLVGRGSMGLVWKAYDPQRNGSVVLKFLSQIGSESPEASTRYKKAFENIHSLNHQNICPVYDLLEIDEVGAVLVMKLIEGTSLANSWRDSSIDKPRMESALRIMRPIAEGLDYCHSKGVIHCDVKPDNIIIEPDGTPVLVDFEFATSAPTNRVVDPVSFVAGSRNFIAPEIAAGAPPTSRSDQYSLAVSLLLMVSGKVPSQVWGNCFDVIPEQCGEQAVRKNTAQQLEKAFSHDPASRFTSCVEFIDACKLENGEKKSRQSRKPNLAIRAASTVGIVVFFIGIWCAFNLLKNNEAQTADLSQSSVVPIESSALNKSSPEFTNEAQIAFVKIPAGRFTMGSSDSEVGHQPDESQNQATIEKSFYVSKYEITQHQYQMVMNKNPSNFSPQGILGHKVVGISTSKFPVENVTWMNAVKFCEQLTKMDETGSRVYRLPAEKEWEYFCRAGTLSRFSTGEELTTSQANFDGDFNRVSEVGTFQPNEFGLFDCHGNVWEWCSDVYTVDGKEMSHFRVVKGGSWKTPAEYCRSACRERFQQNIEPHSLSIGIRVVCEIVESKK